MVLPVATEEKLWWYVRHALSIPYLQATCSHRHVPKLHREPHIYTGYRPINKPWGYYFISLFQVHNETVNIWSHLFGTILYAYGTWWCFQDLDFRNSATWGLLVFGLSIVTYAFFSSMAHLLQAKSELAHFIFYSLDYVGIAVYGYGCGRMLYYCSGSEFFYESYMGSAFLLLNFLFNINLFLMLILAKMYYPNQDSMMRKFMFIGSSFSSQLHMSIPLWVRLYEHLSQDEPGPISNLHFLVNHYSYFPFLLFSGLFFACLFPESHYPGDYDIIGHSHQIFHCCAIIMALLQLRAGYIDFISKPEHIKILRNPTFCSTFVGYLLTLGSGCLFIYCMRNRMRKIIKEKHTN